jgi:hypothetical protein
VWRYAYLSFEIVHHAACSCDFPGFRSHLYGIVTYFCVTWFEINIITNSPYKPLFSLWSAKSRKFRSLPQSRSVHCEVERNHLPLPGIEPRLSSPNPVAVPTELSRLMKWCWSIRKPGSVLSEETGNLWCQLVEASLNPRILLLLTVNYCWCSFILFPSLWRIRRAWWRYANAAGREMKLNH